MAFVKGDPGSGTDTGQIVYPVDLLREVAAKIVVDADLALQQHQTLWKQIEAFLHDHDDDGKMAAVLNPYEKRMRDSYNWQMDLATSIFSAIDMVTSTDDTVGDNFTPHGHGRGNIF